MKHTLNTTWLVQRLLKPINSNHDNPFAFGGGLKNGGLSENAMKLLRPIFSFDYMGSAEFEFGAIPTFFKEVAENIKQYSTWEISIKTIPIYVIGRTSLKGYISNRILELSKNNGYSLKEYSGIADAIDGENKAITGWLELDNNFMFFIDKPTFEKTASLFELNTETNEKTPASKP